MSWYPEGVDLSRGGVYIIENILNGKVYIGSTYNLQIRFSTHLTLLKNNKHHNAHLQNSRNKYGENSFVAKVLHAIDDTSLLLETEQYYLDLYPKSKKYNIMKKAKVMPQDVRGILQDNSKCIPVCQLDRWTGKFIKEFKSFKEAQRQTGVTESNIRQVVNNSLSRNIAGGYLWQTKEDYDKGIVVNIPKPAIRDFYQIDKNNKIIARHKTIRGAARKLGTHMGNLVVALQENGGYAQGYFWIYVEEWNENIIFKRGRGNRKYIYQLDMCTKNIIAKHNSITDAAKSLGIDRHIIKGALKRRSKRAEGFLWLHANDYENNLSIPDVPLLYKPVYQIDKNTGEIVNRFESINEARLAMGVSHAAISYALYRENGSSAGYGWKFVPLNEV